MVVGAAGWLLLAAIAPVRPVHDLERRRSCPANIALETATFGYDGYGMARTSMCFRPTVQDRTLPTMCDVPAVERALATPGSGGRDDQVSGLQEFVISLQELMQVASSGLDLKMRKVGLQPLSQGFGFVVSDRGSTKRMPANVWAAQVIKIDQENSARARMRKRAGNRRADRPAPDDHDGGIQHIVHYVARACDMRKGTHVVAIGDARSHSPRYFHGFSTRTSVRSNSTTFRALPPNCSGPAPVLPTEPRGPGPTGFEPGLR